METKKNHPMVAVKSSSKSSLADILDALTETKIRADHLEIQFKCTDAFFDQYTYDKLVNSLKDSLGHLREQIQKFNTNHVHTVTLHAHVLHIGAVSGIIWSKKSKNPGKK